MKKFITIMFIFLFGGLLVEQLWNLSVGQLFHIAINYPQACCFYIMISLLVLNPLNFIFIVTPEPVKEDNEEKTENEE